MQSHYNDLKPTFLNNTNVMFKLNFDYGFYKSNSVSYNIPKFETSFTVKKSESVPLDCIRKENLTSDLVNYFFKSPEDCNLSSSLNDQAVYYSGGVFSKVDNKLLVPGYSVSEIKNPTNNVSPDEICLPLFTGCIVRLYYFNNDWRYATYNNMHADKWTLIKNSFDMSNEFSFPINESGNLIKNTKFKYFNCHFMHALCSLMGMDGNNFSSFNDFKKFLDSILDKEQVYYFSLSISEWHNTFKNNLVFLFKLKVNTTDNLSYDFNLTNEDNVFSKITYSFMPNDKNSINYLILNKKTPFNFKLIQSKHSIFHKYFTASLHSYDYDKYKMIVHTIQTANDFNLANLIYCFQYDIVNLMAFGMKIYLSKVLCKKVLDNNEEEQLKKAILLYNYYENLWEATKPKLLIFSSTFSFNLPIVKILTKIVLNFIE